MVKTFKSGIMTYIMYLVWCFLFLCDKCGLFVGVLHAACILCYSICGLFVGVLHAACILCYSICGLFVGVLHAACILCYSICGLFVGVLHAACILCYSICGLFVDVLHAACILCYSICDLFVDVLRAACILCYSICDLFVDVLRAAASPGEHLGGVAPRIPGPWRTGHHVELAVWDGRAGLHQLLWRHPTAGLCVVYPGHPQHQHRAWLHGQAPRLHRQTHPRWVFCRATPPNSS